MQKEAMKCDEEAMKREEAVMKREEAAMKREEAAMKREEAAKKREEAAKANALLSCKLEFLTGFPREMVKPPEIQVLPEIPDLDSGKKFDIYVRESVSEFYEVVDATVASMPSKRPVCIVGPRYREVDTVSVLFAHALESPKHSDIHPSHRWKDSFLLSSYNFG